jgi:large repetitive protein
MKNDNNVSRSRTLRKNLIRLLTTAGPILAITFPGVALAQTTVNTARVAAPVGTFEINAANNESTDTDTVLAVMVATNDNAIGVNGNSGATAVLNVFTADTVNGVAASATNAILAVAAGSSVPAGLIFDTATGNVDVAAGTPAGTYTFDYTICERTNPANCKTATVSVTVIAAALVADPDSVAGINGATGAPNVLDVIAGDTLNGSQVALAQVNLTVTAPATPASPGAPVPSLDVATGQVSVPAGTPAGTYAITYQICERLNPSNCSTNTASITVAAAAIVATNDNAPGISGYAGATAVANAFTADTINGIAASGTNATLAVAAGSSVPAGLSFDTTTGNVDVAAGTPAGTYTFDYTICERLNPANCQTATISVTVIAAPIAADVDSVAGINGANGGANVLDVIMGDTLNGTQVTLAQINLSVTTPATPVSPGAPVPSLDVVTGQVSVPVNTPAGTYTITYQICERLNPANCATNTATVTVAAATIVATNDSVTGINGLAGATAVVNAFTADTVNGVGASSSNAILSVAAGSAVPAGLTFDTATGNIDVAAGTPAGTYTFDYTICERLNPSNCQTATIAVTVIAATITAVPDAVAGINGVDGAANVLDVIAGDTLNGAQVTLAQVNLSVTTPAAPVSPGAPVPTLDVVTGQVSVPANTPAGTYTITYQICERLNPTNCASTIATVTVNPSVDLQIVKSNGASTVYSGSTVTYTLTVTNNGPDSATGAVVTDTPGAGLTCAAGNPVTIAGAGAPAGSFTISNLTGAGITLGTLGNGQSVTVTYDCQAN